LYAIDSNHEKAKLALKVSSSETTQKRVPTKASRRAGRHLSLRNQSVTTEMCWMDVRQYVTI